MSIYIQVKLIEINFVAILFYMQLLDLSKYIYNNI